MPARRVRLHGPGPLGENELGRLTFLGAAGEVTGSCYLLETPGHAVLVECGMFQGGREEEERNRRPFAFDPSSLDAVVLTHAHIDHSGLLPKLVKEGFRGTVHVTAPTAGLLRIMLPDSAHIQEQDAENRSRRRRDRDAHPQQPIYDSADAERALQRLEPQPFDAWLEPVPGVRLRFRRAGHILGASHVELVVGDGQVERRVVFSGDVGRPADALLRDPDPPQEADLLLLESTYGDRDHKNLEDTLDELAGILADATERGGNVVIPVFAVGRAQEVLLHLARFERDGRIPELPVFMDSPMAIHVNEVYPDHEQELRESLRADAERLGRRAMEPRLLELCRTPEESMALNRRKGVVILAASGMCDAGRVVHHLRHNLPRADAHVVIVGFQARHTRGRALVDGARSVRIFGREVPVRAHVHTVGGFSAHAGQSELLDWSRAMVDGGAEVALVHGEPDRREALAEKLAPRAGGRVHLPMPGDGVVLTRRGGKLAWREAEDRSRA